MKFDLTINSLEVGDLGELISQLRPHWNQTEIKVKTFTEGEFITSTDIQMHSQEFQMQPKRFISITWLQTIRW